MEATESAGPFEWPCDPRIAHGPHSLRNLKMDVAPPPPGSSVPVLRGVLGEVDCPGVKAHPATMIGGADPVEREITDAPD